MSFLRRYSFSAIGFNMLISVFSAEFGSLLAAYAHNIHGGTAGDMFEISIPVLIEGLFASGAVMITFGAILGKASPLQLLLIATLEIIFYTINFYIGALEIFKAVLFSSFSLIYFSL
jgi:ammonium transporter Rh